MVVEKLAGNGNNYFAKVNKFALLDKARIQLRVGSNGLFHFERNAKCTIRGRSLESNK